MPQGFANIPYTLVNNDSLTRTIKFVKADVGITDTRTQLIQKIAYKSVFFEFEVCAVFLESGLDLRRT